MHQITQNIIYYLTVLSFVSKLDNAYDSLFTAPNDAHPSLSLIKQHLPDHHKTLNRNVAYKYVMLSHDFEVEEK